MALTRKEFLVRLAIGGTVLGASSAVASFLESCSNPAEPQSSSLPTIPGTVNGNKVTVDISAGSSLAQNGFAIVQYTGGTLLVARTDDGVYHAMTSICTHQSCTVNQFNSSTKEFICPCHGSRFSNTGAVTNGPAAAPLKQYVTSVNANQLTITIA
jgi:cytochrome b6-f complex iron-sulfur subunit